MIQTPLGCQTVQFVEDSLENPRSAAGTQAGNVRSHVKCGLALNKSEG